MTAVSPGPPYHTYKLRAVKNEFAAADGLGMQLLICSEDVQNTTTNDISLDIIQLRIPGNVQ